MEYSMRVKDNTEMALLTPGKYVVDSCKRNNRMPMAKKDSLMLLYRSNNLRAWVDVDIAV